MSSPITSGNFTFSIEGLKNIKIVVVALNIFLQNTFKCLVCNKLMTYLGTRGIRHPYQPWSMNIDMDSSTFVKSIKLSKLN